MCGRRVNHQLKLIHEWCLRQFGEEPIEAVFWTQDEDFIQVFLRLSQQVLITDFIHSNGELNEPKYMAIHVESWMPGSIQTRRLPNGTIRFKHRVKEIFLLAKNESPDTAQALLEEWLMEMRGDSVKPREKSRRLADIKRLKDRISQLIKQAELNSVSEMLIEAEYNLEMASKLLSGQHHSDS